MRSDVALWAMAPAAALAIAFVGYIYWKFGVKRDDKSD